MKKVITLALIALITVSASAQRNSRRDRQTSVNMTELFNTQAEDLAKTLKLKKEAKTKFTAMFLDWQTARFNAINPTGGNAESEEAALDFKNMTDEQAEENVQKNFDRQIKQMDVDKEYYAKFKEFLTPVQAAQVLLNSRATGSMGAAAAMMGRMGGMGGFPMGGMGGFGGGMPMGGGFGGGMPMGGMGF